MLVLRRSSMLLLFVIVAGYCSYQCRLNMPELLRAPDGLMVDLQASQERRLLLRDKPRISRMHRPKVFAYREPSLQEHRAPARIRFCRTKNNLNLHLFG